MLFDVQFDGQAQGDLWYKSCFVDLGCATCCMADEPLQPI